jgi:hypothetical protein
VLEAEAPEAEALRVESEAEAEALKILALPHYWLDQSAMNEDKISAQ